MVTDQPHYALRPNRRPALPYATVRAGVLMTVWAITSVLFWLSHHAAVSVMAATCSVLYALSGAFDNADVAS